MWAVFSVLSCLVLFVLHNMLSWMLASYADLFIKLCVIFTIMFIFIGYYVTAANNDVALQRHVHHRHSEGSPKFELAVKFLPVYRAYRVYHPPFIRGVTFNSFSQNCQCMF